ncbi:unnamed protein product [Nesidiocoris tenuis]|uniref:Uncharacterized protein n=1 Tax=Nesidiocoris tenuis TaxID=355587 RepID=A0A6H5HAP0_9HEMI|nr:unnamed protein product [Nesidiocoris tenuis]
MANNSRPRRIGINDMYIAKVVLRNSAARGRHRGGSCSMGSVKFWGRPRVIQGKYRRRKGHQSRCRDRTPHRCSLATLIFVTLIRRNYAWTILAGECEPVISEGQFR